MPITSVPSVAWIVNSIRRPSILVTMASPVTLRPVECPPFEHPSSATDRPFAQRAQRRCNSPKSVAPAFGPPSDPQRIQRDYPARSQNRPGIGLAYPIAIGRRLSDRAIRHTTRCRELTDSPRGGGG